VKKANALRATTPNAKIAGLQETVDASDILLVAIPWNVLPDVLKNLTGLETKVLIDATNRFGDFKLTAAEELAQLVPGANVVKAFNTIGFDHMDNRQFSDKPTMLIAGDDAEAKQTVMTLAEDLGFEAMAAGMLQGAAATESLARARVGLSRVLGRDFAFKVVKS
jgi:8-hydroxy-5-deazaflavin:NADPH oxidoreductase